MRRSLSSLSALLLGALSIVALSTPASAATRDNFMVRTTGDYLALCEATPGQDNYVAAVHFCEGFAVGAFQYYAAVASHNPAQRYVCLPDPAPSRDSAMAAFVTWARAHPDNMAQPPVESIFRYLSQTYPCAASQQQPPARPAN